MPRFQIKRKTREPKPEVVPEVKVDEQEVSLEFSSESEDESEPLTERFQTLEVAEEAPKRVEFQSEPEYAPERRSREASVVRQRPIVAQNQNYYGRRPKDLRQMYRQPRSIQYPKPSVSRNGRPSLHYKSFYGPNSAQMTTQDKARQLYHSCFG